MPTLSRDGVTLAYEEAGRGAPPMLLVHGWMCGRGYMRPQLEHFSRRRRVVAVDLRGHGESDRPEQDYTMAGFAGDLAWLCGELGIEKPIVVGHSMGGVIAFELAVRQPELPAAVVALDSPLAMPRALLDHLRPQLDRFRGPDYREQARRFVEGMFLPTDDRQRRARIVESMTSAPQPIMVSAMEQLLAADAASAESAREIRVPLLVIASAGGHMGNIARLKELCPRLVVGQTVGAGHFHQLEVPEQVNAMIERFIATVF